MSNFSIINTTANEPNPVCNKTYLLSTTYPERLFQVIYSPFGNCQTFAISPFQKLFYNLDDYAKVMDMINEIRNLCGITKPLCQVDIYRKTFNRVEPYIKVHAKMEYVNPTGSAMVGLLIKL